MHSNGTGLRPPLPPRPSHRGRLVRDDAKNGYPPQYPTEPVADRLRELLGVDHTVQLTDVFYATTPEARSTARILQLRLSDRPVSDRTLDSDVDERSRAVPPAWRDPEGEAVSDAASTHLDLCWEPWPDLNPRPAARQSLSTTEDRIRSALIAAAGAATPPAVALVGHSPQIEQFAAHLQTGPWWRRRAWLRAGIPVRSGEVVCMAVDVPDEPGDTRPWNGRLAWQISPGDAAELIREKIKSKMESAKQLSAVITLLLTVLLGAFTGKDGLDTLRSRCAPVLFWSECGLNGELAAQISFFLLVFSLGLFLAAMYAYDGLLMPPRFWPPSAPRAPVFARAPIVHGLLGRERERASSRRRAWFPERPPGSTAWVLNRNMQRTWAWLFQSAVALVAASIVFLAESPEKW